VTSFDDTVTAFLYGLRMTESGGNYTATTRLSSASGAYQYLDSTWGHYGGYARAKDAPRAVQDAKARADIIGKWNKYHDWASVAASWMYPAWATHKELWGGAPTPGNMVMQKYVDRILGYAKLPAATQGGSGGGGAVAPTTTQYDAATLAARYGYAAAFFQSNPELQSLINQATAGQWTPEEFQARLQNTNWFKANSEQMRKWAALNAGDPAEADRQRIQREHDIEQKFVQMGVQLSLDEINIIAEASLKYGWDDFEVQQAIAAHAKYQAGQPLGGQMEQTREQIYQDLSDYGLNWDDKTVWNWAQEVVAGNTTIDRVKSDMMQTALSKYPGLADQLNAGQTVRQAASAYIDQQAQLLELDPQSIDIGNDPLLNKALQYRPQTTGSSTSANANAQPGVMPLWQFSQTVKQDPRWMKTDNARNSLMDTGTRVLRDLGLAA
jgi:hypothetical protein